MDTYNFENSHQTVDQLFSKVSNSETFLTLLRSRDMLPEKNYIFPKFYQYIPDILMYLNNCLASIQPLR